LLFCDALKSYIAAAFHFLLVWSSVSAATPDTRFDAPTSKELSAASVFVLHPKGVPRGVLVLCPGQNGSSEARLVEAAWSSFAQQNHSALVGLHFVSNDEDLKNGRGYFVAERGSGELLEKALGEAPFSVGLTKPECCTVLNTGYILLISG
jgi:hypothetical protein